MSFLLGKVSEHPKREEQATDNATPDVNGAISNGNQPKTEDNGMKEETMNNRLTAEENTPDTQAIAADTAVNGRAEVLYEDMAKRSENGSHYVNNDGTTRAVFTAHASHYFDKAANAYRKIDNTLVDSGDYIENKENAFKARFSKNLEGGKIFEMSKNDSKVGLISRQAAGENPNAAERLSRNTENPSEIVVRSLTPYADAQYLTEADRVKENIIIRERAEEYIFDFDIAIENLTPELSEDGKNLELKNKVSGDTEFVIPPPFMFDADQNYSDEVYYEIAQETDDLLKLKVVAAPEFINAEGRAFPVVIDPQIIEGGSPMFGYKFYYRTTNGSSGSGTYGPWQQIFTQYMRVYHSSSEEYKAEMKIKASMLNLKNHKITKAVMKIYPYSVIESGPCLLNSQVINVIDPQYYVVDITDYLRNSSADFTVALEPYMNNSIDASFYEYGQYGPIIEVEYITNENTRPTIKEFSLAGCMTGALNLGTGELTAAFDDAATEGSALTLGVSHHFKKNSNYSNYGKNWRLNLEQTLVKNTDSPLDANYIYTDEAGDKHGFRDFYYYLDNQNKKIYIEDKAGITVEQDGSLRYIETEVFKEQRTATGLKAVTQLQGFHYIELFEQRREEQIQLEETVENYKDSLKDLVVVTTPAGTIVRSLSNSFLGDKLTKEMFKIFMDVADTEMIMPKGEAITLRNLRLQDTAMDLQDTALGQQMTAMDQQREAMGNQETSLDLQKCSLQVQEKQLTYQHGKEEDADQKSLIDGVGSLTNPDQKWVVQQQIANIPSEKSLLSRQKTNLSNQKTNINSQRSNTSNMRSTLLTQINYITSKRESYIAQAKKLFKEYFSAEYQLAEFYRQAPVNYLIDKNQVVRGFNQDGKLVAVSDAFGNQIVIGYDTKERISSVYEGEEKKISFRYNHDGLLTSITDARGRKTKYTYSSSEPSIANLTAVTYADGRKITFQYDSSTGNMMSVESSDKLETELTYTNGKPTTIVDYSLTNGIFKGKSDTSAFIELERTAIAYGIYQTEITYPKGDSDVYVFNAEGNISLHNTERDGAIVDSYTYDYVSKEYSFHINPKKDETNHLAEVVSQTKSSSYLLKSIQGSSLDPMVTDYMFGAYATAKNSLTTGMRMKTKFYQQNKDTTIAAKFEIRAHVVYASSIKQVIASFDYSNKNKQYIAVPVTLDEDANGNAVLPVRIDLYVDFSSNNGSAVFDTFTFQEAEWSYSLLDEFDKPTLTETNWEKMSGTKRVKTVTVNTYDDEQKPVKERTEKRIATVGGSVERKYEVKEYAYNQQGQLSRSESYVEGEEAEKGVDITERFYDAKGLLTKEISYNSLDSTTKFYAEAERAENGVVVADIDETGENKTRYEHISGTGIVQTAILPDGGKYVYGRGEYDEVTGITQSTEEGEESSIQTYRDCGVVTELTSGLHTINYEYDEKRRRKKVTLDGDDAQATSYVYDDGNPVNGFKNKVTVKKNGTESETRTDRDGNLLSLRVKEGGGTQVPYFKNTFDANGRQTNGTDNLTGSATTYTYDPIVRDRLNSVARTSGTNVAALSESNAFDALGQLTSRTLSGAVSHTYGYQYKNNAAMDLEYITLPNGLKAYPQIDVNGRSTGKILTDAEGNEKYGEYLSYLKVGDHGTNTVSTMRYGRATANGYAIHDCLKYKYDRSGNISEIRENGLLSVRYTYDKLQRLIREDNRALGKTWLWTYDNFGNILYRRTANYTTKPAEEIGTFQEETAYAYDGSHPDRLVSFGEQTIAYNAYGQPTSYRGKTLEWNGIGQLTSADGTVYGYDGYGKRIKRGNLVYTYDLGGRLVSQSDGLEFYYDGNGLTGFKYNGEQYVYRKNAQGDIAGILDKSGNIVVKYTYDAWGNCTAADTSGINLGSLNPFRYRSYYYDETAGLYYLKTRYYDPATGRFISQDDVSYLDSENLGGLNLFAYCLNNPVVLNDHDGTAPKWWEWLINGLVIAAGVVLCATGVGTALGVSLLVAGGTTLLSNTMSAAGVEGKVASIVTSALNIVAGIALCFTPLAALGASMIGGGIGGIAGGYISESLGGSFETGAMIGSIIGSIVGGQIYKGLTSTKLYRSVSVDEMENIKSTGKFSIKNGTMEVKQFGYSLKETRQFGNAMGQTDIVKTRIPNSILRQLDTTPVDGTIFKHGTVTVTAEMLDRFNLSLFYIRFLR